MLDLFVPFGQVLGVPVGSPTLTSMKRFMIAWQLYAIVLLRFLAVGGIWKQMRLHSPLALVLISKTSEYNKFLVHCWTPDSYMSRKSDISCNSSYHQTGVFSQLPPNT